MNTRVIPSFDQQRAAALAAAASDHLSAAAGGGFLADRLGRPLRDLRISVTDRCNFRCAYCMPKAVFDNAHPYLPHAQLLRFEEIVRVAGAFLAHGVRKLRLTGGEPLLRKDVDVLVARLAALRSADGRAPELTLTTNGALLARKAAALKAAGLARVTVSLDALDDAVFRHMNDVDFPVAEVLAGITAAQAAGLGLVKVNMVVRRGVNEHDILPMARRFKGTGVALRFIEYMDVGATNGWRPEQVLPSSEVRRRIGAELPLTPLQATTPGETAERWAYADGGGEIGFISSVTHAFCRDCNRARLSTDGRLFPCLFATQGQDVRALLRGGASDAQLTAAIARFWQQRSERYSELRGAQPGAPAARRIEMSYIGG